MDDFDAFVFVASGGRQEFAGPGRGRLEVHTFDSRTLTLRHAAMAPFIDSPLFFAVSSDHYLYVTSGTAQAAEALVTACRFDRHANRFLWLNTQPALGNVGTYIAISERGRRVFLTNYNLRDDDNAQTLVVYGLDARGGLTEPITSVRHQGIGVVPERQERSHGHCVIEMAEHPIIVVADLGIDRLVTYRLHDDGTVVRLAETEVTHGGGPRHMAYDSVGHILVVVTELDSSVTSLVVDSDTGELTVMQSVSTLPPTHAVESRCADVMLSPDCRYVYVTNRGHDSIATFALGAGGRLDRLGFVPSGGPNPRSLALSPNGNYVFCANQDDASRDVKGSFGFLSVGSSAGVAARQGWASLGRLLVDQLAPVDEIV